MKPNKRIFNNAKVSDHFAIIPTTLAPKGLSEPEQKLYDMVTKRFLAVFYPAAEFLVTTRITRVEERAVQERRQSDGERRAGWRFTASEAQDEDTAEPRRRCSRTRTVQDQRTSKCKQHVRPSRRRAISEATLLSAMEGAGKLVEDEELREAMSEKGLGTPATRAAIIEGLIYEKYIVRNGRELQPTAKAFSLMDAVARPGRARTDSPELTGDWEFKLQADAARRTEPRPSSCRKSPT